MRRSATSCNAVVTAISLIMYFLKFLKAVLNLLRNLLVTFPLSVWLRGTYLDHPSHPLGPILWPTSDRRLGPQGHKGPTQVQPITEEIAQDAVVVVVVVVVVEVVVVVVMVVVRVVVVVVVGGGGLDKLKKKPLSPA